MGNCKKDHSDISEIMEKLPIEQGGAGRHKCAACAYEQGLSDGYSRALIININYILENLPTSQAGSQRHKSAHLAYILGYRDGLLKSYQDILDNKTNGSQEELSDDSSSNEIDYFTQHDDSNTFEKEFAEEIENSSSSQGNDMEILNYKIEDLMNHEIYQFNDFNTKYFSIRTYNALRPQGIITLRDVINYKGDIMQIPRAGRKAVVEFEYLKDYIVSLIQKYGSASFSDKSVQDRDETTLEEVGATKILLDSLSEEKREIAVHDYKRMINNWDNRKAALFINNYTLQEFVTTFCDKSNNVILNARGVGPQKGESIILFKDQISRFLSELSSKDYDPKELRWELISRSLSEELQSEFGAVNEQALREYYIDNGHVPFFQLFDLVFFMMASDSKFGSSFVHWYFSNADSYPVFEEEDHSYETDRIRSIRVLNFLRKGDTRIPNNDYVLYNCVSDYIFLVNSKENQYIADQISNYDIVSVEDIEDNLSLERCEYLQGKEALSVLGRSLSDIFTTYGGMFCDDDFEGVYLIKNEFHVLYNFKDAIAFFREIVESNHTDELKYNIRDFVRDRFEYWNDHITNYDCIENIISILSKLLRDELKLGGSLYMDELTLEPNAKKTIKEVVYDALNALGRPSTPEEILAYILDNENCENIDVSKVQSRLTTDDRIVATKFEHRYDLRLNNPLIGSIRDFIIEVLSASDVPLSPQDIYDKIHESRRTGFDSFNSNLKQMDNVQKYIGELYGIKGKIYADEYILDVHANFTDGDRLAKITNFVSQNNRLPAANDGPDWRQLRSWWDRIPSRQQSMSEVDWNTYQALAKEVESMNNGLGVDIAFEEKANQVVDYIKQHHALPSKEDNAQLANWYQKQWKSFLSDSLTDAQLNSFISVLKAKSDHA